MAKQAIGFKVKSGSIGDLQFGTRKDGNGRKQYIVGEKGGVDKQTILSAPEFANTRRNMSEFGRAGTMSKDFNNLLSGILSGTKDGQATSAFTGLIRRLMNLDTTNAKGERVLDFSIPAVLQGLVGFSWSKENYGNIQIGALRISSVSPTAVTFTDICEFNAPVEADKAEVTYTTVSKDASGNYVTSSLSDSNDLDSQFDGFDGEALTHGGAAGEMLLVIASVKFFQTVNGTDYELRNKSYRAATIVHAGVVPAA